MFKAELHLRSGERCLRAEVCTAKLSVLTLFGYLHQSRSELGLGKPDHIGHPREARPPEIRADQIIHGRPTTPSAGNVDISAK